MRRLLLIAVLFVSCSEAPGSAFDAADASAVFLEDTTATVFPDHGYRIDAGSPTGAWCSGPDGSPDRSMLAVQTRVDVELRPGDDPVVLADGIIDHWEGLGLEVRVEGWGTSSLAGVVAGDRGGTIGFAAVDHDDDGYDVLQLSAVTACYPKP